VKVKKKKSTMIKDRPGSGQTMWLADSLLVMVVQYLGLPFLRKAEASGMASWNH